MLYLHLIKLRVICALRYKMVLIPFNGEKLLNNSKSHFLCIMQATLQLVSTLL